MSSETCEALNLVTPKPAPLPPLFGALLLGESGFLADSPRNRAQAVMHSLLQFAGLREHVGNVMIVISGSLHGTHPAISLVN